MSSRTFDTFLLFHSAHLSVTTVTLDRNSRSINATESNSNNLYRSMQLTQLAGVYPCLILCLISQDFAVSSLSSRFMIDLM